MGIGISLCLVTCIGYIAAEAINGWCLCFVSNTLFSYFLSAHSFLFFGGGGGLVCLRAKKVGSCFAHNYKDYIYISTPCRKFEIAKVGAEIENCKIAIIFCTATFE